MEKIKFCILDVYPNDNFRICKDTAGGYGTGNNFGNTILSKILNVFTASQIHQPTMGIGYLLSILKGEKTIIMIAHRLSTLENCDCVFEVTNSNLILK